MGDFFMEPTVSTSALNRFFDITSKNDIDIQTLQIWKKGKCILRMAPEPYSCNDKKELYSLSKSFISTAFGLAFDRGLIKPSDRVIDIFPEHVPEKYDKNLEKVTFSHVLSMNSGHAGCVMPEMFKSDDPIKAFMSQPFPFEPGTHFAYNTGCSCLVSAAINKVTGMNAMDFLQANFFLPLDMENMIFNTVDAGINEGGIGMQASSDDLIKLGLLYLNKGVVNGKRILSEEWTKLATTIYSDNSCNGSKDWCAGYCYQFWKNAEAGFRGDGACGQLCIVLPEYDSVIAVQAMVGDMQREIDEVLDLFYHIDDDSAEPLADFTKKIPSDKKPPMVFDGTSWQCEENVMGITSLHFRLKENETDVVFVKNGREAMTLRGGNGTWVRSALRLKWIRPKLVTIMDAHDEEEYAASTCAYENANGELELYLCEHSTVNRDVFKFSIDGDTLTMTRGGDGGYDSRTREVKAKRIK